MCEYNAQSVCLIDGTSMDNAASDDLSAIQRYELNVDGRLSGFIEYYPFDHVVIVTHTEVDARLEGKGYGSQLARQALEYFREQGMQVVPICGFFARYVRTHAAYAELVTPASRLIFDI
jgi:predicted GNAT family acetyltransferase